MRVKPGPPVLRAFFAYEPVCIAAAAHAAWFLWTKASRDPTLTGL